MPGIPLVDLKTQYQNLKIEIRAAIQAVMDRTDFVLGQDVELFEGEFARFVGVKHAAGVASGTDALTLILRALDVAPGDEVILPVNTFAATAFSVSLCGARPVFADVNEDDFNLDVDQASSLVMPKTRAIVPVHLFGRVADMDSLLTPARKAGIPVVEDACQAHGSSRGGKSAGGLGTAAAFSFYPGKNLGAYGDGGAVTTNDEWIAHKVRMLRNYGQPKKYHHDLLGCNSRLDTIQAAVLRVKLRYLDRWNRKRRELAALYREALADAPVIPPSDPDEGGHVYHVFAIRTQMRDALLDHLHNRGIGAGIHYPVPLHLQKPYRGLGYVPGDFPVAERLCQEILSLPIYPEMTEYQVHRVADAVIGFFKGRG